MTKTKFDDLMARFGDAVILTDKGYLVATTDFSTNYISTKAVRAQGNASNSVTVFSWDKDRFITLDLSKVKRITPLTQELKRGRTVVSNPV